jgi:outer membrane protein
MKCAIFRIRWIFLLWLPGLTTAQTPIPDSLTVEQAVQLVLQNHPAIQQASQGVIAAGARVEQSRSAYYPEIEANAFYSRVAPVPSLEVPGLGSFSLFPKNNYNANLSVRHTFFDFGKRASAVELAQSFAQTAGNNVEFLKTTLAFQTVGIFYAILYLQENLSVQNDLIDALNQHLMVTQKKAQTGTATDFDVLTTQVRVATAKSQKIDIDNLLQKQNIALRQLLDMPQDQPLHLRGGFAVVPIGLNADSLVAITMAQRPEIKLAGNAEATAKIQNQLAALGDKPSLKLDVAAGFKNGYIPDLNTIKGNWDAGIQIQVPIFNGYRTRTKVDETRAKVNAAEAHTRDIERQIASETQQAIADVQASLEKIQTSELQIKQAEQAVAMAETRYNIGVITNLDLLDAQTSLSQAKLVHLKALYDFVRSRYALERAIGRKIW